MATRRSTPSSRVLVSLVAAAAIGGCASPSLWERRFEPQDGVRMARDEQRTTPVTVRRVPWERLEATLNELESDLAASDIPREEWPTERRAAADAKLLRALQVTRDPSVVAILGVSQFRTTEFDRPAERDLTDLARQWGGDTAVWSSRHLGKADRVIQEPVTTTSTWTGWYGAGGRGGRVRTNSESTTTFVPVRVSADQYEFVAFVLRVE